MAVQRSQNFHASSILIAKCMLVTIYFLGFGLKSMFAASVPTNTTDLSRVPRSLISACTPKTCGPGAECVVLNYYPYCICLESYIGDPYSSQGCRPSILKSPSAIKKYFPQSICRPNSCPKPGSECAEINGKPVCFCNYDGYDGKYPHCTPIAENETHLNYISLVPECSMNSDCLSNEFCHHGTKKCQEICKEPWLTEICGSNSICEAKKHLPVCSCKSGFIKTSSGCRSLLSCPVGYTFDASYQKCRPKREFNSCASSSQCGLNATCRRNRYTGATKCVCLPGFNGNPTEVCKLNNKPSEIQTTRKQYHSCKACGPNSICKIIKERIHCHCNSYSFGTPPRCQRKMKTSEASLMTSNIKEFKFCRKNTDCYPNESCDDHNRCVDLCVACAQNALCVLLRRHEKVRCDCQVGFLGKQCLADNPCSATQPCGPNSTCRVHGDNSVECVCLDGYKGNPYSFSGCKQVISRGFGEINESYEVCKFNSPCGPNSVCFSVNGWPHCVCDDGFTGQPPNCRPSR